MAKESAPLLGGETAPRSTSFRGRVHDLVEGNFDSWFEYSILFLILLNVLAFVVGTVVIEGPNPCDDTCITITEKYDAELDRFELISVIIFTIEYLLRVWSCVEDPVWAQKGRLAYMFNFYALVDLCAIAPFYICLLPGVNDIEFTTALRVFRLIRLLKADKYVNAFSLLSQVIKENAELLIACFYYSMLCLFVFGTILYYLEQDNPDPEMAGHFRSIPEAMYPSLLMLTGEFPLASFSPWGKVCTGFMAFIAVAIFAVPTAVIGSGFVEALETAQGKKFDFDGEDE